MLAGLDYETYSEAGYEWQPGLRRWTPLSGAAKVGLESVGMAVYAEHPSTEVLSLAFDLDDGAGTQLWVPDLPPPLSLWEHAAAGKLLNAWNAGFEFLIWNLVCRRRYGWPELPLEVLRCTMARARAFGFPGKLAKSADLVGVALKDKAGGDYVLKRYSVPRNPTAKDARLRIPPADDGVAAARLYSYNMQDVAAEQSVAAVLPPLPESELAVWQLDQRINNRGIPIDLTGVRKAQEIVSHMEVVHNNELRALTGDEVGSYTEVAALQRYLYDYWGLYSASLDDESIDDLLKLHPAMPDVPKRVLQIRQTMASAGVKKVFTMERMACSDNRIRHLYQYHSAHTGRFAAGGIQPHNLKSTGPNLSFCRSCQNYFSLSNFDVCNWCGSTEVEHGVEWDAKVMLRCMELWRDARTSPEQVQRVYGKDTLNVIAASVRGLIQAPAGREFICSDYSAIEAVGLAVLAGEQWRIDVFRTHGKIYEMCASKITGTPFEEYLAYKKAHDRHHPHRKPYGKVPELACFGENTLVLTEWGWCRIKDVAPHHRLWDGVEWVEHDGVIARGLRETVVLSGVVVTPDHKVACGEDAWVTVEDMLWHPLLRQEAYGFSRDSWRLAASYNFNNSTGVNISVGTARGITMTMADCPYWNGRYSEPAAAMLPLEREVFDVLNCGPRSRFLILTLDGPLLVHNSGYAGWIGAWKNFGAGEFMTDDEIKRNILAWRAASPAVVELWGGQWRKHPSAWEFSHELYGLEGTAIAAVLQPGTWQVFREAAFIVHQDVLYMRLPSGRMIPYHKPQLTQSIDRYSQQPIFVLSYEGWNTNPNNGPMGWIRMETRGGPLTNNYVQATCRDVFVQGMQNVEAGGYPVVMHTHDELISEVPVGWGDVGDFEAAMMRLPDWCAHWPVKAAGGWRGDRYRKD